VRLLAIETTTFTGSVAAFDAGRLLAEQRLDPQKRSAQSLAPAIHHLLTKVGWKPGGVELIAVAVGPGSFTGLRVGVTTAKTLAYTTGAQVLGVNTLEAIAHRAPKSVVRLWAVIDAHRGQVFAAQFARDSSGALRTIDPTRAIDDGAWLALLEPGETVTGPGLSKFQSRLPDGVTALPPDLWPPTAETVGQIALGDHVAGRLGDLWSLAPQYHRQSAAEERLRPV
jgi:tRNA threonylcarbamoyladenosine biosynthesis protein TsaB